ncbi:MAG TPA: amidohydrolase [Ignavibacteriaceae bacterium]|nr:amidohydrolase [Ignavibacteriaceae bacterium]
MPFKDLILIILISLIMTTGYAQHKIAFINGSIYTVNEKQPTAEAVLTKDDRILFVGSNDEIKNKIDDSTEVINLNGKFMMPGFNDAHLHFVSGGFYLMGINLRPAKTLKEFREILTEYIKKYPGKWVTGGRWDHENWDIKKVPAKEDIDDITGNTPVFVKRMDGHMGLANSRALELAGITKDTPSPEGGLIEKDPQTGEPTGILKDNAMDLMLPAIPDHSSEDYYDAALIALKEAARFGITSVQDILSQDELPAYDVYKKLESEGKLTCRISVRWPIDDYKTLVNKNIKVGYGDKYLRLGSLKAYADGSLGSSTAWFFERYEGDKTNTGLPNSIILDGKLKVWAEDADKNQMQISTHAIGDRANSYMLDLYEKVKQENPVWDRRFRIEHAQHVRSLDIPRFSKIGVIASVQPTHAIEDGVWAIKRIGSERIKYTHPYRSFLDNGVMVCFGTDWPVVTIDPLLTLYAAVTRRTVDGKNPEGWIPQQKISIAEAIKCYTLNSAYAEFTEKDKGTIEQGKYADFVVLEDNLLKIDPVKIKDVKVDMTVTGGKIVYRR